MNSGQLQTWDTIRRSAAWRRLQEASASTFASADSTPALPPIPEEPEPEPESQPQPEPEPEAYPEPPIIWLDDDVFEEWLTPPPPGVLPHPNHRLVELARAPLYEQLRMLQKRVSNLRRQLESQRVVTKQWRDMFNEEFSNHSDTSAAAAPAPAAATAAPPPPRVVHVKL